jgi:hypothetical protein
LVFSCCYSHAKCSSAWIPQEVDVCPSLFDEQQELILRKGEPTGIVCILRFTIVHKREIDPVRVYTILFYPSSVLLIQNKYFCPVTKRVEMNKVDAWCHNTQHDDIQHNDTQHNKKNTTQDNNPQRVRI